MNLTDPQMELLLLAVRSLVLSGLILVAFGALRGEAARHRAGLLLSGLVLLLSLPLLTQLLPPVPWLQFGQVSGQAPEALPLSSAGRASASRGRVSPEPRASDSLPASAQERYEGRQLVQLRDRDAGRENSAPALGSISQSLSGSLGGLRSVSLASVVAFLWLLGSCFLVLRLLMSLAGLETLRRRSVPVSVDLLPGLTDGVDVRCGAVASPLTFGLVRPVVILPAGRWQCWSHERLKMVLQHETEHITRRDWASRILAESAVVLYWFNPLVWHLRSRLRLEQEFSCDQAVLDDGWLSARSYGEHLLDLAEQLTQARSHRLAVGMAKVSTLEQRIMSMTRSDSTSRKSLFRLTVLLLAAGASTLAALQQEPASPQLREVLRELEAREARMEPFHREMQVRQEAMEPHLEQLELKARQMESELHRMRTSEVREVELAIAERARQLEEHREPYLAATEELQRKLEVIQQESGREVETLALQVERMARRLEAGGSTDEPVRKELEARADELKVLQGELNRKMEPILEQLHDIKENRTPSMHAELEDLERDLTELASRHESLRGEMPDLEPLQAEMELIHSKMAEEERALEEAHRRFEEAHAQDSEVFERMVVAHRRELAIQLKQIGISPRPRTLERIVDAMSWDISADRVRLRGSALELEEILGRDAGLTPDQIPRAVEYLLALELEY